MKLLEIKETEQFAKQVFLVDRSSPDANPLTTYAPGEDFLDALEGNDFTLAFALGIEAGNNEI